MENLRNRRYKFKNLRNSISSLDDTTSSLSRVGDLTGRVSNFGSFSGFGGSDLQTAASGHGGYGHHGGYEVCCENGVDIGTLLALLGGKQERFLPYFTLPRNELLCQLFGGHR